MTLSPAELSELVWMTSREAAQYARLSYVNFRKVLARGECRSSQAVPGGDHRIRREWVDEYLETRGKHRRDAS